MSRRTAVITIMVGIALLLVGFGCAILLPFPFGSIGTPFTVIGGTLTGFMAHELYRGRSK